MPNITAKTSSNVFYKARLYENGENIYVANTCLWIKGFGIINKYWTALSLVNIDLDDDGYCRSLLVKFTGTSDKQITLYAVEIPA